MAKYLSVKFVDADPFSYGEYCKDGEKLDYCGMSKISTPTGQVGHADSAQGYRITYQDGYISWCPKGVFEGSTRPIEGMTFGFAIEAARIGKKIARSGWKNMFVVMMPSLNLPSFNSQVDGAKVNDRTAQFIGKDTPLNCVPYFAMYAADGSWVPGWLASQIDMQAEDWQVVK